MAKTITRKPARKSTAARSKLAARPKTAQRTKPLPKPESGKSAADAVIGLLESPVVADVLAAGAAAALAAFTQHSLSRRKEGGSKRALKNAAKAAAAAMGTRISEEFEEIMDAAKRSRGEER